MDRLFVIHRHHIRLHLIRHLRARVMECGLFVRYRLRHLVDDDAIIIRVQARLVQVVVSFSFMGRVSCCWVSSSCCETAMDFWRSSPPPLWCVVLVSGFADLLVETEFIHLPSSCPVLLEFLLFPFALAISASLTRGCR